MLSVQHITENRSAAACQVAVEVVTQTESTNTDLLNRAPTLTSPVLLVAERQTRGRGRSGRPWHSEAEEGLTFSLAWKFRRPIGELPGLSLAVGVAVSSVLERFGVPTTLKWPNDILRDGKKLGGILIETRKVADGVWAVIGIGVNLRLSETLEAKIGQPAAEARWLAQLDRNTLLAAFLNRLAEILPAFEREGFPAFAESWNGFHAHAGKKVRIQHGDQVLWEGVAQGVSEDGRLLLETGAGIRAISAGDVSLRATEG